MGLTCPPNSPPPTRAGMVAQRLPNCQIPSAFPFRNVTFTVCVAKLNLKSISKGLWFHSKSPRPWACSGHTHAHGSSLSHFYFFLRGSSLQQSLDLTFGNTPFIHSHVLCDPGEARGAGRRLMQPYPGQDLQESGQEGHTLRLQERSADLPTLSYFHVPQAWSDGSFFLYIFS